MNKKITYNGRPKSVILGGEQIIIKKVEQTGIIETPKNIKPVGLSKKPTRVNSKRRDR